MKLMDALCRDTQNQQRTVMGARLAAGAAVALISAGLAMTATSAQAQQFPSGQMKVVVPFPPGGSTDLVARMFAIHLGNVFKQTVVVENKPGGGGMLGPTYVAKSKPDGLTILLAAPTIATAPATMKSLPMDPQKDLAAISQIVESPYVVSVNINVPVNSLQELIDYAKKNPNKLNYGYFATGSRLTSERFLKIAGLKMASVGYRGEALMMAATASGEVQVGMASPVNMGEYAARKQIKVLAVTTEKRLPAFKDVPTAREAGVPEFDSTVWFGMFAPAGTPIDIRRKIAAEVAVWAKQPEVISKLAGVGFAPRASTPEDMAKLLAVETQRAIDIATEVGLPKL